MKSNKDQHAALRLRFTTEMEAIRSNNAAIRRALRDTSNLTPRNTLLRGLRDGDRELCLALAFLNDTPYSHAEAKAQEEPLSSRIERFLEPCFPGETSDLIGDILGTWFAHRDLRPSEIASGAYLEAVAS